MDARNPESFTERGEFYLSLARAFLTPLKPETFDGLRDALADDLADLGASLGYDYAVELEHYRQEIAAFGDHGALLQRYSGLFIAPPRSIQINTGSYLDGAVNGGSVTALEAIYQRCGVERSADFRDLSDHISVQLEVVALLYFRCAEALECNTELPEIRPEHFLDDFVAHWLSPFIRDLEQDAQRGDQEKRRPLPNPYLPLARILAIAVENDAVARPVPAAEQRAQNAITKARHDRAVRGVTAEDMAFIARKLQEKGLSTDHLAIAPELRDEAQGLRRKQPPSARRGAR